MDNKRPITCKVKSPDSQAFTDEVRFGWKEAQCLARNLARKLNGKRFKTVIGIQNGGLYVVNMLQNTLNSRRKGVLTRFVGASHYIDRKVLKRVYIGQIPRIKFPVLLVDDVVDTGDTVLELGKKIVRKTGRTDIKVACLHYKVHSKIKPEYYAEITDKWVRYPWR